MSEQETALSSASSHLSWAVGADRSMVPFVAFDVSRKALTLRLLKNKFFGILTFGLYRFWGKTHVRRLMWQSIKVGNDRLEYHGTAKELFIGFLIALVVLSLLFTAVGTFLHFLVFGDPNLAIAEQITNFALLYAFWQFARYRLWRYRLSRTSLRTVRFFLQGKALVYTGKTVFWTFLSVVSLGWAYPYLRSVQANYQMNNVAFGDQTFHYQGDTARFYSIYWPSILVGQFIFTAYLTYVGYTSDLDLESFSNIEAVLAALSGTDKVWVVLIIGSFVTFLMLVFARVAEFKYVVSMTRFAGARFSSALPASRMLLIFAGLFLIVVAGIAGISLLVWAAALYNPATITLFAFALFFSLYVVFDIIKYLFLIVPMVKVICKTLSTDNVQIFEEVAANAHNSPKYGEGLADALDVGAF